MYFFFVVFICKRTKKFIRCIVISFWDREKKMGTNKIKLHFVVKRSSHLVENKGNYVFVFLNAQNGLHLSFCTSYSFSGGSKIPKIHQRRGEIETCVRMQFRQLVKPFQSLEMVEYVVDKFNWSRTAALSVHLANTSHRHHRTLRHVVVDSPHLDRTR